MLKCTTIILKSHARILPPAVWTYYLQTLSLPILHNMFTSFVNVKGTKWCSLGGWAFRSLLFTPLCDSPAVPTFRGRGRRIRRMGNLRIFLVFTITFTTQTLHKLCKQNHRHWEDILWEKVILNAKKNICCFPELIFLMVQKFNTFIRLSLSIFS